LVPKTGRSNTRANKKGRQVAYNENDESSIIAMFKQQAMPYLSSPPRTEIEWLTIAQHHGLPTRLLDWTDSLLVAAWFAVERSEDSADGAIWVTREISAVSEKDFNNPIRISGPKSYRPPHINSRIGAQGSVLVICPKPTTELRPQFIKKIVISNHAKFTLRKRLNACGINRRALFPDLAGLCDHLGWLYRHDWLSGYRKESAETLAFIAATRPGALPYEPPKIVDEDEDDSERD
jgi:hypothetical protein